MTTDLEADLRREFDAAGMPAGLTFHADSVLRQGNRTILRRRIIAAGSAAMAVAVVATGASLLTRPDDKALPLPASSTGTIAEPRTFALAQVGFASGTFQVRLDHDASVEPNVHYSVVTPDGQLRELGGSSTGKRGLKPDATWGYGIVNGRPVTIGLVPSTARNVRITFGDGGSYGYGFAKLEGTAYTMFAVHYPATARPTEIASIRWYGSTGIVDGIEGDHRLIGRTLTMSEKLSAEVVLRPGASGPITVFGRLIVQDETLPSRDGGVSELSGYDLAAATADPSGVAVMTGREPIVRKTNVISVNNDGAPIAAGILPPNASDIGVELTNGGAATGLAKTELLPDGRVIFALKADFAHPSDPGTDSIKAITWTNADGTPGRKDVTQQQG